MRLKTKNDALGFIKAGWTGNPVVKNRYENHEFPFEPEFSAVIKWQSTPNPDKALKKHPKILGAVSIEPFLAAREDGVCWIGHATFLIRLNGCLFLTDPVFGSPSAMMPRYSEMPFDEVPAIDALLISHDHRDHTDGKSLGKVGEKHPKIPVITGLMMENLLKGFIPGAAVTELGWYQQIDFQGVTVTFLPSRHWSKRGLFDTKKRLWGAFHLQSGANSVYFGGDSGFGGHFSETKSLLGEPRVAILGIGAYKPEWFMGASHTSPAEAWRAAKDLGAKTMIPMHFGTFDLADEPLFDPPERLNETASSDVTGPELKRLKPGEAYYF